MKVCSSLATFFPSFLLFTTLPSTFPKLILIILTDRFLAPEEVYICIRRPEAPDSPLYLEGKIVLTRSPVVDPGDVRVVRAVGRLPERSRLRMKALENCVVLSSRGTRPLSSMMGGGGAFCLLLILSSSLVVLTPYPLLLLRYIDVDGDVYSIITLPDLIPKYIVEPRSHAAAKPFECPGGRVATIEDVVRTQSPPLPPSLLLANCSISPLSLSFLSG